MLPKLTFFAMFFVLCLVLFMAAPDATDDSSANFEKRLLQIAKEYKTYGRVDADPRRAVLDCLAPSTFAGVPRFSESGDADTHGEKIYFLYAKKKTDYLDAHKNKLQVNQAIVKEAWKTKKIPFQDASREKPTTKQTVKPTIKPKVRAIRNNSTKGEHDQFAALHDGEYFAANEKAALFIMFQADAASSDTDDGWVYGTVSPDGAKVTSVGRVQSCMRCHQDAPHGRLFGLKRLR